MELSVWRPNRRLTLTDQYIHEFTFWYSPAGEVGTLFLSLAGGNKKYKVSVGKGRLLFTPELNSRDQIVYLALVRVCCPDLPWLKRVDSTLLEATLTSEECERVPGSYLLGFMNPQQYALGPWIVEYVGYLDLVNRWRERQEPVAACCVGFRRVGGEELTVAIVSYSEEELPTLSVTAERVDEAQGFTDALGKNWLISTTLFRLANSGAVRCPVYPRSTWL